MKLNIPNPELLELTTEELRIYVLGGIKLTGLDRLRTTLKLVIKGVKAFPLRYSVDLYNTDQTEKLIRRAADHFDLEVQTVRKIIMNLIEELEKYRVEKNQEYYKPKRQAKELTPEEEKEAVKYLKQKDLLQRTMKDIGKAGVIGEEINRLLMYLVFTSRKLNNPLHVISLGPSGVGKSHLQNTVAELIPEEDVIHITSLTKNSLYYFDSDQLNHAIIAIEDLDGATEESLYAIRELQSRKQLSKTVAVKDSKGNTKTETVLVKAIVSVAATTTKEKVYNDNSNRSILIHIDTSKEQDERIMNYQKELAHGSISREPQDHHKDLLKNTQRALKPVKVVNPLAKDLKLPNSVYNPRRTMSIYLSLIEVITFYNQYQRPQTKDEHGNLIVKTEIEDIEWANLLLKEVLLRKSDDLPGAVRSFLDKLKSTIGSKRGFTSKEVRKALRIAPTTLKRYLKELEGNGNIKVKGNRYTGYEYKLLEDDYEEVKSEIEQFTSPLVVQS